MTQVLESYRRLPISQLRKFGYLRAMPIKADLRWPPSRDGQIFSIEIEVQHDFISLAYKGENTTTYRIGLTTTPCNYGGVRYWFLCPIKKSGGTCERRTSVLYGGPIFSCRKCLGLSYLSQNENSSYRHYPYKPFLDEKKIEALRRQMKRKYYKGKPTKLYTKILAIENKYGGYESFQDVLMHAESALLGG